MRYRRVAPAFLILVLLLGFLGILSVRAGWETAETALTAIDDFYVDSGYPDQHYEDDGTGFLVVDPIPIYAYIEFNLSDYNVSSATFSFKVPAGSTANITIKSCNITGIDIASITYSSQPTCDSLLGSISLSDAAEGWYNVTLDPENLTSYAEDGIVLLRLESDNYIQIYAEESGDPAKLYITYSYYVEDATTTTTESSTTTTSSEGTVLTLETDKEIYLANETVKITGTLEVDGSTVANASIKLTYNGNLIDVVETDENGTFSYSWTIPSLEFSGAWEEILLKAEYLEDHTTASKTIYVIPIGFKIDPTLLYALLEQGGDWFAEYTGIPMPIAMIIIVVLIIGVLVSVILKTWKWIALFVLIATILGFLGLI